MLEHIRHRHIAKKLFRPWGERRFLWFANDDAAENEQMPEQLPEISGYKEFGIEEISTGAKRDIAEITGELSKTVAWSPFVLEQAKEMFRSDELRAQFPTVDIEKMERSLDIRIRELESGKDETRLSEGITRDLEQFLENETIAIKMAGAFERRMEHVHDLLRTLGTTNPSQIVQLEHTAALKGKSLTAYLESDEWTDAEVDTMLSDLAIDPTIDLEKGRSALDAEQQRTLDAVEKHVALSEEDITPNGEPTKQFKLKLLQKKVMAARELSAIEKNDIGSETSIDNTQQMQEKLFAQLRLAREHALSRIHTRAAKLTGTFTERTRPLIDRYSQNPEKAATELGISITALNRRLGEVHATLDEAKGTSLLSDYSKDPRGLSSLTDSEFLWKIERFKHQLDDMEWISGDDDTFRRELLIQDAQERTSAISWLASYAPALRSAVTNLRTDSMLWERVTSVIGNLENLEDVAQFAERVQKDPEHITDEDELFLYDEITPHRRRQIEMILASIQSPHLLTAMTKAERAIQNDTTRNTPKQHQRLKETLERLEAGFFTPTHSSLEHFSAKALGIDTLLRKKFSALQTNLHAARKMEHGKDDRMMREISVELQSLDDALRQLNAMTSDRIVETDDLDAYEKACGTKETTGCYNQQDGHIYLNMTLLTDEEAKQHSIYHEQGHAIVDILLRRTGVLPQLFVGMQMYLQEHNAQEQLLERAASWKIEELYERLLNAERKQARADNIAEGSIEAVAKQRADSRYNELLMDELVNKFASYKNGKDTSEFSTKDKQLFALLDGDSETPETPELQVSEELTAHADDAIAVQETGAAEEEESAGSSQAETAKTTTEDISYCRNAILLIREFIDSHAHIGGIDVIQRRYNIQKTFLENEVEAPFYNNTKSEAELAEHIKVLKEDIDEVISEVNRIKNIELDMSKETPSGRGGGIFGFMKHIEFVSIWDIMQTVKQGAEDIQRMWKRRGERVQSTLGLYLTSWIPDNNIVGLRYAGQLKHEFDKRGNSSEIEEVNQWKEAIKDQDNYSLLSLIGKTRNKDQVRAIAELLVERGRMDWNYEPLWHTLNALSNYHMPIEPCKNSDILRDKWLQKLITDIWGDKDKYFDWRQGNDGALDSSKKKFTTTADQLSNISGGLSANLERQLKLWEELRYSDDIPEDVNPHLYEEVLHYSMRNGKMSMEEKLYFLVRGVSSGLLSIDRLRAMAGEDGGILNQFPFIDYFYGKNNSMPEVQALARRLTEAPPNDHKPGPKTTLWLHLELTRNESARQRMAKATSGARTEALDHEDIPTIISQMDYKGVEELTGVLSGSRFKMSYEAAKNTYTGFGTKFKVLAQLAALHKEGKAKFTEQDAQEAAKSIAAYAHLDNILTRNGTDKAVRIEVTLDQIASQTAPSAAGQKVKAYRDGNSKLMRNIIDKIDMDWSEIGANKNEYVRSESEEASAAIIDDDKRQARNFNATKKFSRALSSALSEQGNRNILIDILASMADDFKEENYFDQIDETVMTEYLSDRRKHGNAATVAIAV